MVALTAYGEKSSAQVTASQPNISLHPTVLSPLARRQARG